MNNANRPSWLLFIVLASIAALLPLFRSVDPQTQTVPTKPGADWPRQFAGKQLTVLPLSRLEKRFLTHFPGRIARFTDGNRVIIMRKINQPTRMLHPATDCYQGIGYNISNIGIQKDNQHNHWRSFIATRDKQRVQILEKIQDSNGNQYSDTSTWYWQALLGNSKGPWLAITIAQRF